MAMRAHASAVLIATATLFAPGIAAAQAFSNAPISCGAAMKVEYTCTAAFDGKVLRISYASKERSPMQALYKGCVANAMTIHCPEGQWVVGDEKGKLGALSIGLNGGLPFAN